MALKVFLLLAMLSLGLSAITAAVTRGKKKKAGRQLSDAHTKKYRIQGRGNIRLIMLLSFSSNSFLQRNGIACKVDGRQQLQVMTPLIGGLQCDCYSSPCELCKILSSQFQKKMPIFWYFFLKLGIKTEAINIFCRVSGQI